MITIVGPTASGKTRLAVDVALAFNSEVISGDSRQVYRDMTIGTGKDLEDYTVRDESGHIVREIKCHLIDIREAGYRYSIYEFQRDFHQVYQNLISRGLTPVFCGGSGLYVESILRGYELPDVPANPELRKSLEGKSLDELSVILSGYKQLHNTTDTDSCKRAIRGIEICEYMAQHPTECTSYPAIPSLVVGIDVDRDVRRQRITRRLHERLESGMIAEVQALLDRGILSEDLIYYGLEYKYITLYLTKQLSYDEMVRQLEIAIHQFAKRQMTWFRGMERRGIPIHWIPGNIAPEEKVSRIKLLYEQFVACTK